MVFATLFCYEKVFQSAKILGLHCYNLSGLQHLSLSDYLLHRYLTGSFYISILSKKSCLNVSSVAFLGDGMKFQTL